MRVVCAQHVEPVGAGRPHRREVVFRRHLVATVRVRQIARAQRPVHHVAAAEEQSARLARRFLGGVREDHVDDRSRHGDGRRLVHAEASP